MKRAYWGYGGLVAVVIAAAPMVSCSGSVDGETGTPEGGSEAGPSRDARRTATA
jgi:hypothetical protein